MIKTYTNRYKNDNLNYLVTEYPKIYKSSHYDNFENDDFLKIHEAENIELEISKLQEIYLI